MSQLVGLSYDYYFNRPGSVGPGHSTMYIVRSHFRSKIYTDLYTPLKQSALAWKVNYKNEVKYIIDSVYYSVAKATGLI